MYIYVCIASLCEVQLKFIDICITKCFALEQSQVNSVHQQLKIEVDTYSMF